MDYLKNYKCADRIRNDKHRIFNKELAHYLGLKEAIYISYLVDQDYFFNEGKVGKPFYKIQEHIYYETTLKSEVLRKLNKKFKELNLITIVKIGLPAKNYFQINYEILEDILDKSMQNFIQLKSQYKNELKEDSSLILRELETLKEGNINNKYINNKNSISKDIGKKGFLPNIEAKNNINNITKNEIFSSKEEKQEKNVIGMEVLVGSKVGKETAPAARGGLGPLIEIIREKYDFKKDEEIVTYLMNYLRCHLGCRRLPDENKWRRMLEDLEIYSSIKLPGTEGVKFLKSRAIEIIQRAINEKKGFPYLEFDNIYNIQKSDVMEPQFKENQDSIKGY